MINRTQKNAHTDEYEKYRVPRCVQDIIPMDVLYADGIMQKREKRPYKKFSQLYSFTDVNYSVASADDRNAIYDNHATFLNGLDPAAWCSILIFNHKLDRFQFEDDVFFDTQGDNLDPLRDEWNTMFSKKAERMAGIVQDKYLMYSCMKRDIDEARTTFGRMRNDASMQMGKVGSTLQDLDAGARLRVLRDFLRSGEETYFPFDINESAKKGHDWKDYICPDGIEVFPDCLKIGEKYARVMYIQDHATYLRDDIISEMSDIPIDMVINITYLPVPQQEAIDIVQRKLLGQNTNAVNYNKKQVKEQSFGEIPYELQQQINETQDMLAMLTEQDQRMFFTLTMVAHLADTKAQLDTDTETLMALTRKKSCQLGKIPWQQLDALKTILPFGVHKIEDRRTMQTDAGAALIPFNMMQMRAAGGIYYGDNAINKNMMFCDRKSLQNGNGVVIGVAGGGKSFISKEEMLQVILNYPNDDVIIIDPEREYGKLIELVGGEVIKLSASSKNRVNAFDINAHYGDDANPVAEKADFIMSLCDLALGGISQSQKSIIDRCVGRVYQKYVQNDFQGEPPTFMDFVAQLKKQKENEDVAKDIILGLELFTTGSLNIFAHQTNVDTANRVICYDIKDLGTQLKPMGMLVLLDSITNRVTRNRALRKNTWIYFDEMHLLFQNDYSRTFLVWMWKRMRKYGGLCTGITQNVEDMLRYDDAKAIMANSEFCIMLNQSPTDREEIRALYQLSEKQMEYITNAEKGHGLIKYGRSVIPFENVLDSGTTSYKYLTTKLDEAL